MIEITVYPRMRSDAPARVALVWIEDALGTHGEVKRIDSAALSEHGTSLSLRVTSESQLAGVSKSVRSWAGMMRSESIKPIVVDVLGPDGALVARWLPA